MSTQKQYIFIIFSFWAFKTEKNWKSYGTGKSQKNSSQLFAPQMKFSAGLFIQISDFLLTPRKKVIWWCQGNDISTNKNDMDMVGVSQKSWGLGLPEFFVVDRNFDRQHCLIK